MWCCDINQQLHSISSNPGVNNRIGKNSKKEKGVSIFLNLKEA